MKKFVFAIIFLISIAVSGLGLPCQAEENTEKALQEKLLENGGKFSTLIQENDGKPAPLLSNEELVILIKPVQERLKKQGKEYTDLEIANMLGALGVAEGLRRNMAKAFSKE